MAHEPLEVTEADDVLIVSFTDGTSLDSEYIEQIRPELFRHVEQSSAGMVLLDMENVEYLSSLALGALLTVRLKAARGMKRLALSGIREPLMEIVTMTKVDTLCEIYATRVEALESVKSR